MRLIGIQIAGLVLVFAASAAVAQTKKTDAARTHHPSKGSSAAHATIADFQHDPSRLVKEFSLDEKTRHLPFDLKLAVEAAFGPTAWKAFGARQRILIKTAFEKVVNGIWETWNAKEPEPVRILQTETKENRAVLTVLRGEELLRLKLTARDGAWFITEHEILDDALPEFSDALAGALHPERSRSRIYEAPFEAALQLMERWAGQRKSPEWWLMKYRLLEAQRIEQAAAHPPLPTKPDQAKPDQARLLDDLLTELTTRWPDFAPGHLARARALLYTDENEVSVISPLSQDPEAAVVELRRYIELLPFDPRPHRDLAYAFEQMEKPVEAEAELRRAIEMDPAYLNHHRALVTFYLANGESEKAKAGFAAMLRAASNADDAFAELWAEFEAEKPAPEDGKAIEVMLRSFPGELEHSYPGLALLTLAQAAQNRIAEAIKSLQRAMAIESSAGDYAYLSSLYRDQRRFTEALSAADQAIKLDHKLTDAWFERACSLTQLGRKREALAALKQILRIPPENYFPPDEPDLQPLGALPEFKAIIEKMKKPAAPAEKEKNPKVKAGTSGSIKP